MHTDRATRGQIVDLLRYKQERRQRTLDFEAPPPRPALATVTPFRPLGARDLAHRERMLRHLTEASS